MKVWKKYAAGFALMALVAVSVLLSRAANFLVLDQPAMSDVIVVLAGETDKRPALGLILLQRNFAPRLILDVPAEAKFYQWSALELAHQYIHGSPDESRITICPIHGLSTKDEARDVSLCLKDVPARTVLLVTSDYHTRRALSTFRKEEPDRNFSIAAVYDSREYGAEWWRHREWAKTLLYEWMRLAWWELADRRR